MSELARVRDAEELEAMENPEEEQEEEDVAVLDDASAEMLLDRISWANRQYELTETWYKKQLEAAAARRDRTVAWAERGLHAYFDMVPDSVKKKAKTQISYALRNGKLQLKEQNPKYDPKDEDLVPWLKQNGMGDLVKVKEEANWAELKKLLTLSPDGKGMMTEDGEIVPGVSVELRPLKFEAKPAEKKK